MGKRHARRKSPLAVGILKEFVSFAERSAANPGMPAQERQYLDRVRRAVQKEVSNSNGSVVYVPLTTIADMLSALMLLTGMKFERDQGCDASGESSMDD
jgi:hypothetical protein